VEDIEECREGLRARIRKSKTDKKGQGAVVAVFGSIDRQSGRRRPRVRQGRRQENAPISPVS
jgi:hypothetical protein